MTAAEVAREVSKQIELRQPTDQLLDARPTWELAAILSELSASQSIDVRLWTAGAVRRLLPQGEAASSILVRLTSDHNADVASEAFLSLMEVDPAQVQARQRQLVRWLNSSDYYKPVDAMWLLAELHAAEAIPAIERAKARFSSPWKVRVADIVLHILRDEGAEVLARIRDHDHRDMARLTRAAEILGTREALEALRVTSLDPSIDEDCRHWCEISRDALARRAGLKPN